MRILKRLFATLFILLLLAIAGGYLYLNWLKPKYSGELKLTGLAAPVEVIYDDYAVPHIYAQNESDLFYAFGYVHAQERLFQMEVLRRLADGRLSEVFGAAALPTDKFFRTLSFREYAKSTIASRDPKSTQMQAAQAYLNGINAYLKNGKTPIEFTLAGIPKNEFTLEDMEMIVGYMGYTFEGAFKTEALATYIKNTLGDDYLADIMQNWPDEKYTNKVAAWPKTDLEKSELAQQNKENALVLASLSQALRSINSTLPYPPMHGSNGWVVAGSKTKSGKPILSNDTHIAFSQPSVWYEAHLECPGLKVYGNFLAATPIPALGHNEFGGWGLTMFENDEADFFREKPNPDNPNQVWYKDHWEDMEVRKEVIKVKDAADIELMVKKSRHGIILNEAFEDVAEEKDPIALWWVYYQIPSRHMEVFYNISKAHNANEAREAVKPLTAPGLNFMWGDVEGNIAWWAAGKLPIRPAHVNPNLILDGSTGLDDPTGWYDFDLNPQILNPERGFLYTANNQPDDMGNGLVPGYYVPSDRAHRIEQLLDNDRKDWTVENMRATINDVTSSTYPGLIAVMDSVIDKKNLSVNAKNAWDILKKWDGKHELDNIEPAIYYRLLLSIYEHAFKDELGEKMFPEFEHNVGVKRNTAAFFKNKNSRWWDDVNTKDKVETESAILAIALNESVEKLIARLGNDMSKWKWGSVHSIEHKHPMGMVKGLDKIFNVGPIPVNGGRETVNNLDFWMDSTGTYKVVYGPALRRIIDFANPETAQSVLPTGQSGYFLSDHYADQAKMFATGGSRHELLNRSDIEKVSIGKLTLKP